MAERLADFRGRSYLQPWITVVGPDGAGKSAFVSALSRRVSISRQEHFRPFASESSGTMATPQQQIAYPTLVALAKTIFLFGEQWLAFGVRIRARRRGILVQERGWWDQKVDPRRYRLPSSAAWLVQALGRLLPRPTLLVLLEAPVQIIAARKAELTQDEIERQLGDWRAQRGLASRGMLVLDAGGFPPDDLAEQLVDSLERANAR